MGAGEVETIVQMQYMPSGTEACQQKFCLPLSELDIRDGPLENLWWGPAKYKKNIRAREN